MRLVIAVGMLWLVMASCSVSKNYNPARKFAPRELQEDYALFRNIMEESHPSLYWYTPKDSVDHYFDEGAQLLKDSLPEYKFRNILSYVTAQIRCGHTTVKSSRGAYSYAERSRSFAFPLNIKTWDDTVVVTSNLNRKDSALARGYMLQAIEGRPVKQIIDTFFRYLSADGNNTTHKYQTLSNTGVFRNMYGSIYGLHQKMKVCFVDTSGTVKITDLDVYNPNKDTPRTRPVVNRLTKKNQKRLILLSSRSLRIDSASNTAFMELNSFTRDGKLRKFFRTSFRKLRKQHVDNLVVDLRGNGGGSVILSNLLTKYIADKPFKIADSLYALKRRSHYHHYIQSYLSNRMFLFFLTHKRSDGHYHFSYYENKYFKPKKDNHFNGTTYVLTGGNTFSAAALVAKSLKGQKNVLIVGEETGGGAYGNTAWLIPDVTLPHTGVRFRLPLFRLIIDKDAQKGRGIFPDVEVKPSIEAIRKNEDFKMNKVKELIKEKQQNLNATE